MSEPSTMALVSLLSRLADEPQVGQLPSPARVASGDVAPGSRAGRVKEAG